MGMDDRGRVLESQHVVTSMKKITYVDTDTELSGGTYQMKPHETCIMVSTGGAAEDFILQMPPCGKCAGKGPYTIWMTARDTTNVTLKDYKNDTVKGTLGGADVSFNLADDWIVLISNGLFWVTVDSNGI